ncbi:MAG TPA: low affinity iron permease family protein [Kofleriaceae bacterium]|nr:low affinity iron permease family protein [Kofleriaceae bacterium]
MPTNHDTASHRDHHPRKRLFDRFSTVVTRATGSSYAFLIALAVVAIWGVTGPIFDYSNSWQLVINTGTTIITFLMVFVIQQSQNKDTLAIQLKLNELIASDSAASNRVVDIEDLSSEELAVLKKFYVQLARLAATAEDVHASHSLDEADDRHQVKLAHAGKRRTTREGATASEDAAPGKPSRGTAQPGEGAKGRPGKPGS